MNNYIKYIIIAIIVIPINTIGQTYTSATNTDFINYVNIEQAKYQAFYDSAGTYEGSGYKHFMRWLKMYQEIAYNDNGLDNAYASNITNYLSSSNQNIASVIGDWKEIGPIKPPTYYSGNQNNYKRIKGTGRIVFVEFNPNNPNNVFVGSPTGGLFYSLDYGSTWVNGGTDKLPNPGISHFQMTNADGTNPESWYVLTGDADNDLTFSYGVYRSTNQGQSWENISNGLNIPNLSNWQRARGRKLLVNPTNNGTLFAIFKEGNVGVYKSTNIHAASQSVVWTNKLNKAAHDICYLKNSNYNKLIAGTSEGVYISNDAGENWSLITNPSSLNILDVDKITLRVTDANPNIFYAVFTIKNNYVAKIGKYNLQTSTWSQLYSMTPSQNEYIPVGVGGGRPQGFEISPTNENVLFMSHVEYIYKNSNSGIPNTNGSTSWVSLSNDKHDDTHWICYAPNNSDLWIATDGGVNLSTDGGYTWVNKTNNIGVANPFNLSFGAKRSDLIFSGGWDTGIRLYKNDKQDWYQMPVFGDSFESLIDDTDPENPIFYVSTQSTIWRSDNNGVSFYSKSAPSNIGNDWFQNYVKDWNNQSTLYYSGVNYIARSKNKGDSWEIISPIANNTSNPNRMYFQVWNSKTNSDYLYAIRINNKDWSDLDGYKLYKTTNCNANLASNVSWSDITPIINNLMIQKWVSDVAVDEINPNKIWAVYSGFTNNSPKVVYYNGTNWSDITSDANSTLNNISVSSIVKIPGREQLVFIGTNNGVYYKSPSITNWTKLEGLPNCVINEMEFSRELQKIRVATYGRGIWEASIPCSLSDPQSIIVDNQSGDLVWSIDKAIGGSIYITNGRTLTINNNAVLTLSVNQKIVIEPGARLIIDNATITSGCGSYWDGIQVLGDKDAPQTYSVVNGIARPIYQGEVIIKNGGTIRNSVDGIMAIKKNLNGSYDWSKTGGIIRANGAKFINNNNSIWIGSYQFNNIPNRSRINDCHFEWNNNMLPGHTGYSFIGLTGTNAVYIIDNEFINKIDNDMIDRGCGIYAYSSTIYVNGSCASGTIPCSSYNSNKFDGLYYGIYSSTGVGQTNKTVNINHNNFVNVYNGIYLNNAKNPRITLNDFQVADYVTTTPTDPYGLWLNECDGYKVEENSITKTTDKSYVQGIIVNNSGDNNNEIYNNTLHDLYSAIQPQGHNRDNSNSNGNGLKLFCNTMYDNTYDFNIFGIGIGKAHQIADGNDYVPAGDKFTYCNQGNESNIKNTNSGHINYLSKQGDEPNCISSNVNVYNGDYVNHPECPSKISNGNINTLYSELATAKIALNSSQLILSIWKDGGDANLENEVATTQPWDIYVQFNDLLAQSPYLSDEVLLATINNVDFTSLMVKLIMVANPHASHNDEIMQAIYDRLPAMPQSYIDEILSEGDEVSQLEILEANVSADKHLMNTIGNNIKYIYRTDSINSWASDSLRDFIDSQGTLNSRYELASFYFGKGEFENMNSTLSAISNTFTIEEEYLTAHNNWLVYFTIAQSAAESGLQMDFLDELQINQLETIVGLNLSGVSGAALALLFDNNPLYDGYQEIVLRVTENSTRMPKPNQEIETSQNIDVFKVFPNPANDYITVEYRTGTKYLSLTIEIRDLSGKLILNKALKGGDNEELIGIGDLKPGIYTLILLGDGDQVEIEKLTVISK